MENQPTPAAELRAAVVKLRALAIAISAPDERDQVFHADGADITQGRRPGMYDVATAQTVELADYIAAMHPGVGLTLADWLDEEVARQAAATKAAAQIWGSAEHSDAIEWLTNGYGRPSPAALAVARTVLGCRFDPPATVREVLGHATVEVTSATYAREQDQ